MLEAASFVLLDWELWPTGTTELANAGIAENIEFLRQAREHVVPVFVFTNTSYEEVEERLPECIYDPESPARNFIFVRRKADVIKDGSIDFDAINSWIVGNPSVYALKTWHRVFKDAKKDLFGSLYAKSQDWPRVFWKTYVEDSVDPSSALTLMINDSLRGRMRLNAFEASVLNSGDPDVSAEEIRALISETSVASRLSPDDVRCGDLFVKGTGSFLLNLRPDCDCIPRDGQRLDRVRLFCIEGSEVDPSTLEYHRGQFLEAPYQAIVFAAVDGKCIQFDFKKLCVQRFGVLKERRVGRLLHPYLTRIQQRYAMYQQRQALPRIPEEAVPSAGPPSDGSP